MSVPKPDFVWLSNQAVKLCFGGKEERSKLLDSVNLDTPAVAQAESYGRAVDDRERASRSCHLYTLN